MDGNYGSNQNPQTSANSNAQYSNYQDNNQQQYNNPQNNPQYNQQYGNAQYGANQGNSQYGANQGTPYNGNPYNGYQDNTANMPYQVPPQGNGGPRPSNGLQVAGLVCGILAICFSCCYGIPGLILGIAGLVCSINGNKEGSNGIGTAGMVCSIIGIILGVLMLIYFIIVGAAVLEELQNMGYYY